MGAAFLIAVKDLKLRFRDRSVFILGIVAPLALAFIFNVVFGPAASGTGLGLEYGVVDLDHSEISTAFVAILEEAERQGILTVESHGGPADADAAIEAGDIDAYFLIPVGLSQAVMTNVSATVDVIGDIDAPTSTQIAASFAEQFSAGVAASQVAVATTARVAGAQITPEFIASLGQDPARAASSFTISDQTAQTRQLDATTYFSAGMAAFFLFFTVQFGVLGLLEEERDGTLARLFAAPISRLSVIGGKAILSFAIGVLSMGVLVVATSLLPGLGADWGAPLGVAILVIAGVLSAVGIMGLVASMARTPETAGNLGSIIAVILAMLGGTFFPIGSAGGLLSRLTYVTPHAWFLRGLGDLAGGAVWSEALPAAGAMMIFALVTGVIAWSLLRRRWAR